MNVAEKKQQSALSTLTTVLHADEIADLKRFHDNSLAESSRRAYRSDYDSFVAFLKERFRRLPIGEMQTWCTLEHVLAYLNAKKARRSARSIVVGPRYGSTSCRVCFTRPRCRAVETSR
jgi:hypothetical protein